MTWHPDIPEEYRNKIVTGDARELAKRIPDESIDLILTDPPFGIGYDWWDVYEDDEYLEFLGWIVNESNRTIKSGGLTCVFQAGTKIRQVISAFPSNSRIFVACKNFVQMRSNTPVQWAYDPVFFWQKEGKYPKQAKGRDWHIGNTANTKNRGVDEAGFHSCPRPLSTIMYMVENFSSPNDVVLDWFVGSGTLALACKLLGRNYIAFEIDPDTAEMARERVEKTQPPLFVPEPEQLELS